MPDIYLGGKQFKVTGSDGYYPLVAITLFSKKGGVDHWDVLTPSQARELGQLLLDEAAVAMVGEEARVYGYVSCDKCRRKAVLNGLCATHNYDGNSHEGD